MRRSAILDCGGGEALCNAIAQHSDNADALRTFLWALESLCTKHLRSQELVVARVPDCVLAPMALHPTDAEVQIRSVSLGQWGNGMAGGGGGGG